MEDELFFRRSGIVIILLLLVLSVVAFFTPSHAPSLTGKFVFFEYRDITLTGAVVGIMLIVGFVGWYVRKKMTVISHEF